MHARFVSCVVALGLLLCAAAGAWGQPAGAGSIRAARVRGNVTLENVAAGTSRALAMGDTFGAGNAVVTAEASSAVLVLSNGASLTVGPASRLEVDEFLQDPFETDFAPASATAEPTRSQTKLDLAYGEVTAQVKHLNTAAGATFEVQTKVGVAGIRGTTVRFVVRELPDGRLAFSIELVEGEMYFNPADGGPQVVIASGEQLLVSGIIDPASGQVTIESSVLSGLSEEAGTAIGELAADAVTAGGEIVFEVSGDISDIITNLPPEVTPALPETTPGAGSAATAPPLPGTGGPNGPPQPPDA